MSNHQLTPRMTAVGSGIGRATGFESTSPDLPTAANIDSALERNRMFAAAGGHHGAVVFPNLSLFVITCLDPRVDPAHFLGLDLSDAMVVRNVGGRVAPEAINDVAFIGQLAENMLPDGPLFEVAVIHHTQCGTAALADDTFRHRYAAADRRRRIDPARARRPRPRGDRHPRRGAPALSTRDLPTRDRVRARLRRGHRPGGDDHPRGRSRSNRPITPTHPRKPDTMTTTLAPDLKPDHSERDEWSTRDRDVVHAMPEEPDTHSFDPTQGRKIGSDPYDDPTQGRKIGSDPYDDPTRAR